MRAALLAILMAVVIPGLTQAQQSTKSGAIPQVFVIAKQHCGDTDFVVLKILNPQTSKADVYLPSSPLYQSGHTVHNIQLEVNDKSKWQAPYQGTDMHPAGIRRLEPGEWFFELVPIPPSALSADAKMRFVVPVETQPFASYREVRTDPFTNDLPESTREYRCPEKP